MKNEMKNLLAGIFNSFSFVLLLVMFISHNSINLFGKTLVFLFLFLNLIFAVFNLSEWGGK